MGRRLSIAVRGKESSAAHEGGSDGMLRAVDGRSESEAFRDGRVFGEGLTRRIYRYPLERRERAGIWRGAITYRRSSPEGVLGPCTYMVGGTSPIGCTDSGGLSFLGMTKIRLYPQALLHNQV